MGRDKRGRQDRAKGIRDMIIIYKIDKHQGYIIEPRVIQIIFFHNFKWSIIYINIKSLCFTLETNITL